MTRNQSSSLRRIVAGLATVVTLASMIALAQPAAHADHALDAASGQLNTRGWRICHQGDAKGAASMVRAANILNNNTILVVSVTASGPCINPNVNVRSYNYLDTFFGSTSCTQPGARAGYCIVKQVLLNKVKIEAVNADRQWNKTGLHELGHVGALGHRFDNTLMTQGESPPIDSVSDAHDHQALNNTYN